MGNSQSKESSYQKENGNQGKNISLANKHIDNGKNKGNNTNNKNSSNYKKISLDIVIETLIRMFRFEQKIDLLCKNEDNKNNDERCVIVSKNLINNYKKIFEFPEVLKYINNMFPFEDNKIEDPNKVKQNKENDISKIIGELNKRNRNLMEKIKKNISLLGELNQIYKFNYTSLDLEESQKKVIDNFEIINYEIFLLLIEQNISTNNFLFADYFFSYEKILILIKDLGDSKSNIICEVGKYNREEKKIIIKYLLDNEKIEGSTNLKDKIKDIGLSNIYKEIINRTKKKSDDIEFIIYDFDFKNNDITFIDNNKKSDDESLISQNEKNIKILKKKDLRNKVKNYDENRINIIGRNSENLISEREDNFQEDEKKQNSNSQSEILIDNSINNEQENENSMEAQNKNDIINLQNNKTASSQNNNNGKNSLSEIPQSQNNLLEINTIDKTNEENIDIQSKLRQIKPNTNNINPSIRDQDRIVNNNHPESESFEKPEADKNEFEIKDVDNADVIQESGNSNLKNSNNDTQANTNNNPDAIRNPEGLNSSGDIVETKIEDQNHVNNSQEAGVAQNENDTKNKQIKTNVEAGNKGSDNVHEEPHQDEKHLDEINLGDIVESSPNSVQVVKENNTGIGKHEPVNNSGNTQINEIAQTLNKENNNNNVVDQPNISENKIPPAHEADSQNEKKKENENDKDEKALEESHGTEISEKPDVNDTKDNKVETEKDKNQGEKKVPEITNDNPTIPDGKPISTEESNDNILSEAKDKNNNGENLESEKPDKNDEVESNPSQNENDILNNNKANEELNNENVKNEGQDKKEKEAIDKEKKEGESHPPLPEDDKKNRNVEVIFNDKEDSADKNEESTELQDEVSETVEASPNIEYIEKEKPIEDTVDQNEETENQDEVGDIAEVSPNINNIEKEELKDKKDSVDKNEESADLPDEEIEIAEVSQNISDIKKEDSIQDSADKNEETEQPDEVGEIAEVSPNIKNIEKEELKDKKDSGDKNEESIDSPDEEFEISEVSPNINCIEKEKPIEDTVDIKEETEHPDEVGEIAEVSPNMDNIEKEELKDKKDSIDTNDKSIENPDEVNENAEASPSISENNKNDNVDKQVQKQPSHIILKKFSLPHSKLNAKTKQLLLFSIYQKKMTESKSNRSDIKENEDVILINKEFFEKYSYNEIVDLVSDNNEYKEEINNIDVNNFSISSIKNIIIKLDNDKLNAVNDKISKVNEDEANSLLKPKEEEVKLLSKEIKIYNEFVVINRQIFTNFEKIFNINLEPQNVSYVSFNKDFILKLKENEETVLVLGRLNKENSSNEISYILDFKMQEEFNNQFPMVYSYGVEYYVSDKLMLDKKLENDYISPIFNFENMLGYGYKYEPTITDYNEHDNYIKFLNCENLDNIFALFSYEMLFEEKKKSQQLFQNGKYYLVNREYFNYFKKMYNYNLISQTISPYEPENIKNLYTFIKKVPSYKLDMYWNYKMEYVLVDENSNSYYMVEPELIVANYKKSDQVISYDNFFLIEEKSGKALSDNKESSHICAECIFIDGKIIINLPNYLNHSGMIPKCVSIIGNLYVDNCFKIEYILIYITEAARTNHLNSITNNLKENLRNLKFKNNIYTFNFQSNEVTIIKYKKKDNFKLETYFKQRPKIGLDNIGATCYMNSTLQCLTHIDGLVDYFKYDPQIEEVRQNHQNLSSSFKTLVDNLYPNVYSSNRYAPNDFKEKISVMNPLFQGIAANDAKDLVNFIIMTLHNELNKKDEIPDENKDLPQNPDQSNKDQSYLSFENEILREHKSIISDLFYGINRNETQCCFCNKMIYNYQTYFFINFPLEVVRQYRAQKMMYQMNQMNQYNSNEVDIMDCFENEEKITNLSGENSMYCNGCRQNAPSNMRTVLITGPEELILILNRGKGKEFDVKLNFPENLNLYRFIEKKETGYKYKLTGVITHLGESSMSGHFIAFCIDQTNKKWYKYNDSMVDEVADFEKDVVHNSNIMPYLLFYHKLNQ